MVELDYACLSDPVVYDTLAVAAETAGLDGGEARTVLASGRYLDEIREAGALWRARHRRRAGHDRR